jgi:hypothetical protein
MSGVTQEDLTFLKSIQLMTNVVPVISRAGTLSGEELAIIKEKVEHELTAAGIRPLTLSPTGSSDAGQTVYAISSAPDGEYDFTDQSLEVTASFEYMQPLATTDLGKLVDDVLCPDGASWMRHAAATKYLEWRHEHLRRPDLSLALRPSLTNDRAMQWQSSGPCWPERIGAGQDDTSCWSTTLRRCLANSQRAAHQDPPRKHGLELHTYQPPYNIDTTVNTTTFGNRCQLGGRSRGPHRARRPQPRRPAHQDPLGLLDMCGSVKCEGRVAVELLGTLGVLATFSLWAWKGL